MTDRDPKVYDTTNGEPPQPGRENLGAPQPIDPKTGQHGAYWILTEEERAKGFVRPVRRSYKHTGLQPTHPTRELTAEEHERYDKLGYVVYEEYPEDSEGSLTGRFWTQARLDKSACGTVTTMGLSLAETYARDPSFYGATFCCECRAHLPVGEFVWIANDGKETDEKVGT